MNENIKVCLGIFTFFICFSILALFYDWVIQREARRQFYRDLVSIAYLLENCDLFEYTIELPKILGPRIVRVSSYDTAIKDLLNAYESGLTNYNSFLLYVLSLHKSYCFSDHDLTKFTKKFFKEKT